MQIARASWLAGLLALASAMSQAAPYAIDPTHTFVSWEVLHSGLSTQRGRFLKGAGRLDFDREARRGSVEMTLDIASVDTGVPALDEWLRGATFFDAARFAAARFVADRFIFDGGRLVEVAGSLTLRGRTWPLTLKTLRFNCYLHPFLRRETCGGEFESSLQRSAWGLGSADDSSMADAVRLLVTVEAIRQ